jgi:hypothetical protein
VAQAIDTLKTVVLLVSAEFDAAQVLSVLRSLVFQQSSDTETALTLTWAPQSRLVGTGFEGDAAQALAVISGILQYAVYGTWTMAPVVDGLWSAVPVIDVENVWSSELVVTGAFSLDT